MSDPAYLDKYALRVASTFPPQDRCSTALNRNEAVFVAHITVDMPYALSTSDRRLSTANSTSLVGLS
jgi:hypothetical protein